METGYKLFKSEAIKSIILKKIFFGIEPGITKKLAKNDTFFIKCRLVTIKDHTSREKITFLDAFRAIYCILNISCLVKKN